MQQTSALETLPPELQVNIAELTERSDLLALRLVSRGLAAATNSTFLDRYFKERSHIYTLHGLQTLVDIAAVPHLARAIRAVRIVTSDLTEGLKADQRPVSTSSIHAVQTKAACDNLKAREMAWELGVAEKQALRSEDRAATLLTEALTNIDDANDYYLHFVVSDIGTFDIETQTRREPYGFATLRRKLGHHTEIDAADTCCAHSRFRGADCSHAISSLLRAINNSPECAFSLDLCADVSWETVNSDAFRGCNEAGFYESGGVLRSYDSLAWDSITTLQLAFGCGTVAYYGPDQRRGFEALMRLMVNLERLCFQWSRWDADVDEGSQGLAILARAFSNSKLKSIAISRIAANAHAFQSFLSVTKTTLRSLALVRCVIDTEECWSSVFRQMQADLALRDLQLSGLQRWHNADDITARFGDTTSVEFRGEQAVTEGLRRFGAHLEYRTIEADDD